MEALKSSVQNSTQQDHMLVVGLGKTGFATVRYLRSRGYQVSVVDSRNEPPYLQNLNRDYPEVDVVTGRLPSGDLAEFDQIIVSPGIKFESDRHTVGDIELFAQDNKLPVIGITGSNGKSTVTMLVHEMLCSAGIKSIAAGNIGQPVLDCLVDIDQNSVDIYVLELSSFQLETTHSLQCTSAVVLNISEDHMDRYASIEEYKEAKDRVYKNCKAAVFNRDDMNTRSVQNSELTLYSFGLGAPATQSDFGLVALEDERWLAQGDQLLAKVAHVSLPGEQNLSNILAAFALVTAAGYTLDHRMLDAALNYRGLPYRCQLVGQWRGITWINDSKGTNVGATISAVLGFAPDKDQSLIVILGGQGKQADFKPLADVLQGRASHIILFGEDAQEIHQALEVENYEYQMLFAESLEEVIMLANHWARNGQSILFSPACASFDMFKSFEHRGEEFNRLVEASQVLH